MVSCQKEQRNDQNSEYMIPIKKSAALEDSILTFISDVDHGIVADMETNSAIVMIEAALNYIHRKPMETTQIDTIIRLEIDFELDGNMILGSSIGDKFNYLKDLIDTDLLVHCSECSVDLVDVGNPLDSNDKEIFQAVILLSTPAPLAGYNQPVGDWRAGAQYGDCPSGPPNTWDASLATGYVYNYRYAHNFLKSAVYQNEDVFFTNVNIVGTGFSSWGYPTVHPAINPDFYSAYQPAMTSSSSPTDLDPFSLVGYYNDLLNPGAGINDCISQYDINTYATNIENNIYTLQPQAGQEPYKVLLANDWWGSGPNPQCWWYFHGIFFGVPNVL